ncbi:MAG: hypothetical protein U0168_01805 [Nannocystaceae bacterium]
MALRSRTAIALVLLCPAACAGNPVESAESGSVGGSSTGNADSGASASTTKGSSTNSDTTQGTSASSTTSASDVTSASDPTLTSGNDSGTGSDTDPGTSQAVDPTTDGGGSSSGGNAATSNVSAGSSEGTQDCDDIDEPNDSYNVATPLASVDCTTAAVEVANVMDPATGDDWFQFHGDWICGDPQPIAHVTLLDGAAASICLYPACSQPVTTYYACQTGQDNPGMGCCNAPGGSTVDMWLNCSNTDDESADVWVEFQNPGNACEPYSFEYSFLSDA